MTQVVFDLSKSRGIDDLQTVKSDYTSSERFGGVVNSGEVLQGMMCTVIKQCIDVIPQKVLVDLLPLATMFVDDSELEIGHHDADLAPEDVFTLIVGLAYSQ